MAAPISAPTEKKLITPWNKGKKGLQIAWNKGLTKNDPRVAKYTDSPNSIATRFSSRNSGPDSKKWKGGGRLYMKRQALKRDDYTCQECGLREPKIMHVDHITPKSKAPHLVADLANLITLCPNDHARKSVKMEEYDSSKSIRREFKNICQ